MVMVVNPSVPTQTVPEFIAYAKDNPGKVAMASAGTGSGPDVAGELFKVMTGINMLHVPYRGDAPALSDLLGDRSNSTSAPCLDRSRTSGLASCVRWR
jgi:tripartite-type tricarboxylate transporter receptor subunit TctC